MQRRDVVPRDHRARAAYRPERAAETSAAEPAHDAGEADVGGDDAQRAAGAGDLDVVDAHDLAAVDVDDLLVEEIRDQIERLVVGRRLLRGQIAQDDVAVAVDVDDGVDRREMPAAACS